MDVVKECLREVLEGCPVAKCKSLEGCLEELEISPGMLKIGDDSVVNSCRFLF